MEMHFSPPQAGILNVERPPQADFFFGFLVPDRWNTFENHRIWFYKRKNFRLRRANHHEASIIHNYARQFITLHWIRWDLSSSWPTQWHPVASWSLWNVAISTSMLNIRLSLLLHRHALTNHPNRFSLEMFPTKWSVVLLRYLTIGWLLVRHLSITLLRRRGNRQPKLRSNHPVV